MQDDGDDEDDGPARHLEKIPSDPKKDRRNPEPMQNVKTVRTATVCDKLVHARDASYEVSYGTIDIGIEGRAHRPAARLAFFLAMSW
jgi:hypothetical protein